MTVDPVEREWQRLLRRVRGAGPIVASKCFSDRVREGKYPTYFSFRLAEYLLKRGEYKAAGAVLKATRETGEENPLIDELYSSWLWCIGKRQEAVNYAKKKAKYWSKPYLYSQLGALYRLSGNDQSADESYLIADLLIKRKKSA